MTTRVGIFGLGLIGMALAGRMVNAGLTVVGNDPRAERMALLSETGGSPGSPEDVWQAPLIISAVFDDTQLAGLIEAAPDKSNAVIVSMSTCNPDRVAALAGIAAKKDLALVEATISGTSKALEEGTALLLLAGNNDGLDRFETVRPCISDQAIRVGNIGDGNRTKLAINLVLGLNRAAIAEGLVFANAIGLNPGTFLDIAQKSAAASAVMKGKGRAMVARDFTPLGHMLQTRKDFELIGDLARGSGLAKLPFADTYSRLATDAVEAGDGALDNAAILRAVERDAGVLQ